MSGTLSSEEREECFVALRRAAVHNLGNASPELQHAWKQIPELRGDKCPCGKVVIKMLDDMDSRN